MPFITFDGTNGQEIAEAMTEQIFGSPALEEHVSQIAVNPDYTDGPALELDWWYYDGQRLPGAYHIPVGYGVMTETQQTFAPDDTEHTTPIDINELKLIL